MKYITLFFIAIAAFSCSSNEELLRIDKSEREDPFLGFFVTDSVGIKNVLFSGNQADTNTVLIAGMKMGKVWYGQFNKNTKKPIFEAEDDKAFNTNKVIHLGYGEYKSFIVGDIVAFNGAQVANTNYVYLAFWEGKINTSAWALCTYRLDFINNGKITKSLEKTERYNIGSPKLYKWFNSIVSKENDSYYVYSPNGELLFETKYGYNTFDLAIAYFPYEIENCLKITAGVKVNIEKQNIRREHREWTTGVCELPDKARIENPSFKYANGQCNISFEILEYNGNRRKVNSAVNVETGEIIE